jgi:hypothetical protein
MPQETRRGETTHPFKMDMQHGVAVRPMAVLHAGPQLILHRSDLKDLTGYVRAAEQVKWLQRWRIEFTQNPLGDVFVTEEQFEAGLFRQVVPGIPPGEETPNDIQDYQALRRRKPVYYTRRDDPKPRRTPAWADVNAINRIYDEARRLTATTGIRHSVDHVIPLCGRTVTGLHVATNLQIITLKENSRTGNRWTS